MKSTVFIVAVLLLAGCQTATFTNVRVFDQHSFQRNWSFKVISSEKSKYKVYRINSELYAIVSPLYTSVYGKGDVNQSDYSEPRFSDSLKGV